MRKTLRISGITLAALLMTSQAQALSVKVNWAVTSGCSGQSPALSVLAVPKGTAKLDIKMVDLDLPTFKHGGGTVEFTGKTKFEPGELFGMFSTYQGPCPPVGTTHRYEWSVDALDATGKVLQSGKTTIPYKR
jgi:phosphatidylethanolamine-binding protein (PEBP) family uncharacterized protein